MSVTDKIKSAAGIRNSDTELSMDEARELIDLLDKHVRNSRYRELFDKYMNDERSQATVMRARSEDSERIDVA